MFRYIKALLFVLVLFMFLVSSVEAQNQQEVNPSVVINEIHYDPDVRTELVEFIELYNFGSTNVDLSGWYFSDGISYQFPPGTTLSAGGYIIIAQNLSHISDKWGGVSGRYEIPQNLILGPFEGKLRNEGEKIELCDADGEEIDRVDYQLGFPWPTVGDAVPDDEPGTVHSIQLINPFIDNDLAGSWRSALPTPAAYNQSVYLDNPPPHIRQVEHSPEQPVSGEPVIITAKVTDSDGVSNVILQYQIVAPGNYIPVTLPNYPSRNPATISNPAYGRGWVSLVMHDDGLTGDELANDDIYTVQIPGSLQVHRRLIRYRIII
ncbi:MAG: lamin tail domain-containing protein, partial [Phycisphaerales bacterium]